MLDLGPYYCTALVNLLGPAKSVSAVTTKGFDYRTLGAEDKDLILTDSEKADSTDGAEAATVEKTENVE